MNLKRKDTPESRQHWEYAERVTREVEAEIQRTQSLGEPIGRLVYEDGSPLSVQQDELVSEPQRDVQKPACATCGGRGYVINRTEVDGDWFEVSGICDACEGSGEAAPDAQKAGA
jgi:hypothetical protein